MVQLNLNLTFTRVWHKSLWTNFSCHLQVSREQIIKIYIYTCVTLELLNKFIWSLASCTRGLNKFCQATRELNTSGHLQVAHERMIWCPCEMCYSQGKYVSSYVQNAHVATAPLNQVSTNTPHSVLTLLTMASTTYSQSSSSIIQTVV